MEIVHIQNNILKCLLRSVADKVPSRNGGTGLPSELPLDYTRTNQLPKTPPIINFRKCQY